MAANRLAPSFLADPALQRVLAALPGARLVGGCVRDALADRPTADIDLATPDTPDRVMARLSAAGLRTVPTGLRHGTVTAVIGHRGYEVTTLRRDLVTDGRHATVAWTDDWQADAARRDFTINAMSMATDGTVHDYFAGRDDLAAGRVRFVGEPAERIAEDYLRILRFFRFQARFGRGEPDRAAVQAISTGVPGLARLSPERVWSELKRILVVPDVGPTLGLMQRTGVLGATVPESGAGTGWMLAARLPAEPMLRLAALSGADADTLADALRLANAERSELAALRAAPVLDVNASDDDLRRARADWPGWALTGAAWLAGADGAALATRSAPLGVSFPLEGRDVVALGISAGPRVGDLLREVRQWWLSGGAVADAAACRAELARRVAEQPTD